MDWNRILKKVSELIDVKSLVTLALTIAFIVQSCNGQLDKESMMTVYSMVMTFYFVTQSSRNNNGLGGSGGGEGG